MSRQFAINPKTDFTIERFIDAPVQLAWEALTNPEHLRQWYMPRQWGRVSRAQIDLRPGGIISIDIAVGDGADSENLGCILEVIPMQRMIWTSMLFDAHLKSGDTLGADKGYDTHDFVDALKQRGIRPHIARNTSGRRSAIDGRAARGTGYAISLQVRKRIEQGFGWVKTVGDLRKLPRVGLAKVNAWVHFNFAAYNLIRIGGIGEWWNPAPT